MKLICLALMSVLTFSACGGNADLDAFLALDTDKAKAFTGETCADIAKTAGAWRKANTANYDAMREKLKAAYPEGPPKDFVEKHKTQMDANKKAVIGATIKCSDDPDFSAMMDETSTKD